MSKRSRLSKGVKLSFADRLAKLGSWNSAKNVLKFNVEGLRNAQDSIEFSKLKIKNAKKDYGKNWDVVVSDDLKSLESDKKLVKYFKREIKKWRAIVDAGM